MRVLMISYTSLIQELYHAKPRELAALEGVELTVLVPPAWRELWGGRRELEVTKAGSYKVEIAPVYFEGSLHYAVFREKIGHLIRTLQPDIIDIEDEPFNAGSAQAVYLRNRLARKARIVMHASQSDVKRYPPPFSLFEKYSLRNVSAFLARSGEAREVLRTKGYEGPVEVIPHGIDPGPFNWKKEDAKSSLGLGGSFVVGFVGSLVHHKGLDILVRAARDMDCTVLLIGDGSEKESLIRLGAQLGMSDRLRIHPPVAHREVPRCMAAMDVFVLPSRTVGNWREKFGRVLLEAMAAGVPVVGSASGEIPRVIGEAGLVFPEDDVEALASFLRRLRAEASLRAELSEKGRAHVSGTYSWSLIASRTYEVYRTVMSQ
jgi:glycosyltransferase involved in cell wall biosynthesis